MNIQGKSLYHEVHARSLADPDAAAAKFEQAAELKVPAALAVDSVRHGIVDADARMRTYGTRFGRRPERSNCQSVQTLSAIATTVSATMKARNVHDSSNARICGP